MSKLSGPGTERAVSGARSVVLTCLAITILDGVDLIMFGAVLPTLLETKQWGITTASAGLIGSLSLFGMMAGAMLAGYITDRIGRRPVVLACIASFSLFTGLCSLAPNLEAFGLFRLIAGLGFGGALPTLIALTQEYVKVDRRQFYNGVIQTGFPIGGVLVSIAAIFMIPAFGWKSMFAAGGILGVALFVIAFRHLPESIAFLTSKGRHDEARALADRYAIDDGAESGMALGRSRSADTETMSGLKLLLAPGYRIATIMFPLITFFGLLVSYGMNTWIPQMLRSSGYDLGSALAFLLAFNLGSGIGMVVITGLADRLGSRPVISVSFIGGALAVAALTLQPAQALVFGLVLLIGFCASSTTAVYGFVGVFYPAAARGTALGLAVGLGRLGGVVGPILTGLIMSSALGATWAYYAFAIAGVAAAVLVASVPRNERAVSETPAAVEKATEPA
ncbi:MFS transporter [Rhodococcus jostii]|uniref:MFS transporter, AAHS family, benzoate transport protein n=1 Tax=Rhodococcus jostii TaxID=132919 RepID=A0A1H4S2T0_RHOJO|nr:MFS transporter [Rhodococcus jostii]SEC38480.1 MFS transporter, AAHS family, benzoate transport protein [Rhodococcus jostii]